MLFAFIGSIHSIFCQLSKHGTHTHIDDLPMHLCYSVGTVPDIPRVMVLLTIENAPFSDEAFKRRYSGEKIQFEKKYNRMKIRGGFLFSSNYKY